MYAFLSLEDDEHILIIDAKGFEKEEIIWDEFVEDSLDGMDADLAVQWVKKLKDFIAELEQI